MPGSSVVFNLYNDLAAVTGTLTETVDITPVAIPATSTVTVTLAEYGSGALVTRLLRLESLSDVDPAIANMIAYNCADSIDSVVQTVIRGGTNVVHINSGTVTYNSGTTVLTANTDFLTSAQVRLGVAKLRTQKAVPLRGSLYGTYLHPEVSLDLRAESGSTAWLPPHQYSGADNIWAGEIGNYEGSFFVETPRAYNATDGGSSARIFRSYSFGQQALAEAIAEEPHVVIGPVVDSLMRFRPIGWYGVGGWGVYRQASLVRYETCSSIDKS